MSGLRACGEPWEGEDWEPGVLGVGVEGTEAAGDTACALPLPDR